MNPGGFCKIIVTVNQMFPMLQVTAVKDVEEDVVSPACLTQLR